MTTFVKKKKKKSNDQANIVKYKVAANITEYHIISKLIFLRKENFMFKMYVRTFWSQL